MKFKALIVDDEPLGITVLRNYIGESEEFEVVASFTDSEDAYSFLQVHVIDVVLLDVNMPFLNGFELMEKIKGNEQKPFVILTTAHKKYLQKGFDEGVLDYLQKPIKKDRLFQALSRVKKELIHKQLEASLQKTNQENLYIKTASKEFYIRKEQILYVKGLKDYCTIHLNDGNKIIVLGSLKTFIENNNSGCWLVRVHKSYATSFQHIKEIHNNSLVIDEQTQIPIGRKFRENVLKTFRKKMFDT